MGSRQTLFRSLLLALFFFPVVACSKTSPPTWGPLTSGDTLTGIAALAPDNIWTVGYNNGDMALSTIIEHWNGSVWSILPGRLHEPYGSVLNSIVALAPNNIWAAGNSINGSHPNTLIEHWNGAFWSVIASPNIPNDDNELKSIAAHAPNDIWAVGYYAKGGNSQLSDRQPLIEHWDGSKWSISQSSDAGIAGAELFGVVALAPDNSWAVGYSSAHSFIEHWNGSTWSLSRSANEPYDSSLSSIVALAPNNIWAVGFAGPLSETPARQTLTEHWDGTSWLTVSSPTPGTDGSELNSITALAPDNIWAAGFYNNDSHANMFKDHNLIEHWDGTRWSISSSPTDGTDSDDIYGIVALIPNNIWTVGTSQVDHWNNSKWSIILSW